MGRSEYFDTSFGKIHGWRYGHGRQLLLALHGFSESGQGIRVLEKSLPAQFTLIAIDLPFHGKTSWNAATFSPYSLRAALEQIMAHENQTRCSLLGVSFGARLIMGMLPLFAAQLDALYFVSPDGLTTKPLSVADKIPRWLRRFLHQCMKKPGWMLPLLPLASRTGLMSARTARFLTEHLSSPAHINRIFACWLSMADFKSQPAEIRKWLTTNTVPTQVMVGAQDPLLDISKLEAVFKGLPHVELTVLEGKGHRILGAKPLMAL